MGFYGTFAGFGAYHAARGRDVSSYLQAAVEAKLLVASEWLDARYRSSFPGYKVGLRAQVREWPRYSAVDIDGNSIDSSSVPVEVENATYEAALRELVAPGSLSPDWTPAKYKQAAVAGAVSVTYNLFDGAYDAQTRFVIIDDILSGILSNCGGASMLSGSAIRT